LRPFVVVSFAPAGSERFADPVLLVVENLQLLLMLLVRIVERVRQNHRYSEREIEAADQRSVGLPMVRAIEPARLTRK